MQQTWVETGIPARRRVMNPIPSLHFPRPSGILTDNVAKIKGDAGSAMH
jgi:hypothetical protein